MRSVLHHSGTHDPGLRHAYPARSQACILDAAHLLRELIPQSPYVMLGAAEIQRVLLRKACLDAYLDGNLWLPDETEAAQHAVSPIARAQSGSNSRGSWLPCAT